MRLDTLRPAALDAAVATLNHKPRKRLGWNTPHEALAKETAPPDKAPSQMDLWYVATQVVLR